MCWVVGESRGSGWRKKWSDWEGWGWRFHLLLLVVHSNELNWIYKERIAIWQGWRALWKNCEVWHFNHKHASSQVNHSASGLAWRASSGYPAIYFLKMISYLTVQVILQSYAQKLWILVCLNVTNCSMHMSK